MVFFNYALRKLNAKIVYYGPGLCGKTTNLQWVHDNFEGGDKGKMVSLATEGDRTIFFDLLPLDIGKIRGMDVTLQLYTVPGQVHYNSTRQLVLRGADGVVFVADSQRAMQSSNTDSLKNLDENLGLQGVNLAEFPHVIQFNKRDLGELMALEEMDAALNRYDAPFFESVAVEGIGVQETLEGIVRLVMRSLRDRYEARGLGAQPSRLRPAAAKLPMPGPEADVPQPPSGIRPLSAAEVPTIPGVPSGEGLGSAEVPETVAFDIEKEPETVSLDTPPVTEWGQQTPDESGAPEPVIEQLPDLPETESSSSELTFDAPAVDVGPPVGDEAEVIEDLEPVAFEEIDTQTGMLVPPPVAEGVDAFGAEPADLLPEGPGKPFEADDQNVSVAQYDTADVEGFPDSVQDDGGDSLEETVVDRDDRAGADAAERGVFDSLAEMDGDLSSDKVEPAVSSTVPGHDVDDLVAAVLGTQETKEPTLDDPAGHEMDLPDAFDEPEEIAVESVPEESGGEDQAPEMDVFESEPELESEVAEGPFSTDDADAEWLGKTDPAVEVDLEPERGMPAAGLERDVVQPTSRPSAPAPLVFNEGDPFIEAAWEQPAVEPPVSHGVLVMSEEGPLPVSVTAGDNSLALKLTGTGAIVESGQVRALDIEVPVPGDWVGNRKVTLQLRLTLLPISEDENDGTNGPA